MMRVLVALLLLTGCAAVKTPAPIAKPAPSWPQEVRESVHARCLAFVTPSERWCGCFVREFERVSPDPETEATRAEIRAAMSACGQPPAPENAL